MLTILPIYPPLQITKKTHTTNNYHVFALQHTIHAHPHHKLIQEGIGRISHFSASSTGISNMSLLDPNSMHFPRQPGMPLESF